MRKKLRLTADDLRVDSFVLAADGAGGGGTVNGHQLAVTWNCSNLCHVTQDPVKCTVDTYFRPEVC